MGDLDSSIKDSYKSISGLSTGQFRDNGSKFLAFAYPVESEDQVRDIVRSLKKEYYDARHHCYAYRIGYDGSSWRANDDGEPSSSAGRPILGQLLSRELSDVLVVVVRYFGGIKLGIPGLIRAYKESTAAALDSAEIVEKIACCAYGMDFDYLAMNDVMKLVKDMSLQVVSQQFDLRCSMVVRVRLSAEKVFVEAAGDIGGLSVERRP